MKRIRNTSTVQIAPSTRLGQPRGPIAAATARVLSVTEQIEAQTVTDRQFGWLKTFFAKESIMQKRSLKHHEDAVKNDTIFARLKRWMYRRQRPNWMARIANRVWAIMAALGLTASYVVTLEVTGRKSGRIISFPLVVAVVDGERYLVSMLGDNTQWVQNVRAAGGHAVLRRGSRDA